MELNDRIVELIKMALSEILSLDDATGFLSSLDKRIDGTLLDAAHAVVHFVTDADIRKRDAMYDAVLRAELETYVARITTGRGLHRE